MSTIERVTVSLPSQVRQQAQRLAETEEMTFSAVVTSALEDWMRGRLLDKWLEEFEEEFGPITEDELKEFASKSGMRYLPPRDAR
jgi:molybdopterin converting factor small subunit